MSSFYIVLSNLHQNQKFLSREKILEHNSVRVCEVLCHTSQRMILTLSYERCAATMKAVPWQGPEELFVRPTASTPDPTASSKLVPVTRRGRNLTHLDKTKYQKYQLKKKKVCIVCFRHCFCTGIRPTFWLGFGIYTSNCGSRYSNQPQWGGTQK